MIDIGRSVNRVYYAEGEAGMFLEDNKKVVSKTTFGKLPDDGIYLLWDANKENNKWHYFLAGEQMWLYFYWFVQLHVIGVHRLYRI